MKNLYTPKNIQELVVKIVEQSSLYAVSKATGLGLATIHGLVRGEHEPRLKTLQALVNYTGKSMTITIIPVSEETKP
ncbi:MAG: helix-turn-helix domain-containing protein [Desulfuromonadaceae bacterium]